MQVHIVSQEQELYSGSAQMVFAPAEMGEVGILPGHSPFVSTLKSGQITIREEDGTDKYVYVSGGFIEVQPTLVTILSDISVRSEDADDTKILEAKKHAEESLQRAKTEIDIAKAEAELANITTKIELTGYLKDKLKKRGL